VRSTPAIDPSADRYGRDRDRGGRCRCEVIGCGGGHAGPALVEAERRVGVGHQGGVRDDAQHSAVHADDEVVQSSRVTAGEQQRDRREAHEQPDQAAGQQPPLDQDQSAVSRTGSPGSSPQRRRSAAGIGTQDRGGRVTRPDGSRRVTTTPPSAVRVSRSPPRQPSALVTVRSATRPERSTWASPYTTSRPRAGGRLRAGGTASGRVRAVAGARAGRPAAAAGEGMTGAISVPFTAAPRGGRRDRSAPWGGRRHQPGRPRVQAVL
jgi:hypothetical protein